MSSFTYVCLAKEKIMIINLNGVVTCFKLEKDKNGINKRKSNVFFRYNFRLFVVLN